MSQIVSSRLLIPEAHAALARAVRARRLRPRAAAKASELARCLLAEVHPVEVDAALAAAAGELARAHRLRAYDAVHLASYRLLSAIPALLVANDGELARAARSLGHPVAVPGA